MTQRNRFARSPETRFGSKWVKPAHEDVVSVAASLLDPNSVVQPLSPSGPPIAKNRHRLHFDCSPQNRLALFL